MTELQYFSAFQCPHCGSKNEEFELLDFKTAQISKIHLSCGAIPDLVVIEIFPGAKPVPIEKNGTPKLLQCYCGIGKGATTHILMVTVIDGKVADMLATETKDYDKEGEIKKLHEDAKQGAKAISNDPITAERLLQNPDLN